jgi:OOP family OmpA-OmpF porin
MSKLSYGPPRWRGRPSRSRAGASFRRVTESAAAFAALVALGFTAVVLTARPAHAQTTSTSRPAPEFLLSRFAPATAGSDWFALESLDFRGDLRPALRLGFDWSEKPLTLEDGSRQESGAVVDRQMFLHVGLGLTLRERVKLAIDLPIILDQAGTASPPISGIVYPAPDGGGVGDIRASVDLRLFGQYGDPFVLAIGTQIFFPTQKQPYTTDHIVRVMPRLLAAGQAGPGKIFAYAVDFGFLSRDQIGKQWFQGYGIGHELYGAAAVGVKPLPALLLGAELVSYSKVTDGDLLKKRSSPTELLFGARYQLGNDFRFAIGAGPGLTPSKGSPEVRFLARAEWFPALAPPPDGDGDGIIDAEDTCPHEVGVRTGDPRSNGCPLPPDRDRDGVLDGEDACPDDPGIPSDNGAINGCPRPRDRDGDGAFDPADACPDVPGERTEDPKTNGCPPADADKDGVLDRQDACPAKPGEKTDDPRTSGCPDSDGDGLRDPEDACPDQPGPGNIDSKKSGCALARLENNQIQILDQVKFKTASSVLLPESNPILEAVAKVLVDHPELKVVVEGHTDSRGNKAANKTLSARRAAAVVQWLVSKGKVAKARLTNVGLGSERPIDSNETDEGRQANRRVEFHITEGGGAPAAPTPPAQR